VGGGVEKLYGGPANEPQCGNHIQRPKTRDVEAVKFLWKHYQEAESGSKLGSIRLFEEPEAFFTRGSDVKRKHFKERSWKRKQKIFYCFHIPA